MARPEVPEEWTVLVLWTLMIVVVSEVAVCSLLMILMCASLPKLWETFVPVCNRLPDTELGALY